MNSENKDLIKDFYLKVFNDKNLDICDSVIIDNYINHSGLVKNGRENFKDYFSQYYKTFPNIRCEIIKIFAEENLVCVYANHYASNKIFSVKFKAIDIYRIESGKLVEHWDSIEPLNNFSRFMFSIKTLLKL